MIIFSLSFQHVFEFCVYIILAIVMFKKLFTILKFKLALCYYSSLARYSITWHWWIRSNIFLLISLYQKQDKLASLARANIILKFLIFPEFVDKSLLMSFRTIPTITLKNWIIVIIYGKKVIFLCPTFLEISLYLPTWWVSRWIS